MAEAVDRPRKVRVRRCVRRIFDDMVMLGVTSRW